MPKNMGWETRLDAFLRERRRMPFGWQSHDCCMFPADAIRLITGLDPAAAYRAKYSKETGARRIVILAGGMEALTMASMEKIGLEEVPPLTAQRADPVLFNCRSDGDPDGLSGGIVDLSGRRIVAPVVGKTGLQEFPVTAAIRAWRLG